MKKIIGGLRYDTETAESVATHSIGYQGDFRHFREALYRTAAGRWFVGGWGGAYTKYGRSLGHHTRGGGDGIIPLTDAEAAQWLEDYADADTYSRFFPVEEA